MAPEGKLMGLRVVFHQATRQSWTQFAGSRERPDVHSHRRTLR